jgi:hypothetical protein
MGQSTDAILAYGYDLNALDKYSEIDFEELIPKAIQDEIAQVDGHYDLVESIPDFLQMHDCSGVDIIRHCSCDYSMYILGFQAARARRGNVRRLDLSALHDEAVSHDWAEKIKRAAEVLGINVKDQTPGWLLVSMWC